jgi:hypothetical protein
VARLAEEPEQVVEADGFALARLVVGGAQDATRHTQLVLRPCVPEPRGETLELPRVDRTVPRFVELVEQLLDLPAEGGRLALRGGGHLLVEEWEGVGYWFLQTPLEVRARQGQISAGLYTLHWLWELYTV